MIKRLALLLAVACSGCATTNQGTYDNDSARDSPVVITSVAFTCGWDAAKNDVPRFRITYTAPTDVVAVEFKVSPISSFGDDLKAVYHRDYRMAGHTGGYGRAVQIGGYGPHGTGSVEVSRVRYRGGALWSLERTTADTLANH